MSNFKIHFAAKYSLIDILKQANEFEINKRDDNGRTPLHYAALKGHLNALKVILSIGGNVHKCDFFGYSCLHYAVKSRNINCILFLINYEPKLLCKMDNNLLTAVHLADELEYYDIVQLLQNFYNMQMKSNSRQLFLFQIKEVERVQKRKKKYEKKMNEAIKSQMNEYKKRLKLIFGSKSLLSIDSITVDDNIILTATSSTRTLSSLYSNSSCLMKKSHSEMTFSDSLYASNNHISFV